MEYYTLFTVYCETVYLSLHFNYIYMYMPELKVYHKETTKSSVSNYVASLCAKFSEILNYLKKVLLYV